MFGFSTCCSSPRLQESAVGGRGTRATSFLETLQLPRSPASPRLLLLEKRLHLVSTRHFPPVSPSPLNPPFIASFAPPPVDWDIQTCNKKSLVGLPRFTTAPLLLPRWPSHLIVVWCLARWDGGWRWSCAPETVGLPGGMWQMTFILGTGLVSLTWTGSQSSGEISPVRTNEPSIWELVPVQTPSSHHWNFDKEYARHHRAQSSPASPDLDPDPKPCSLPTADRSGSSPNVRCRLVFPQVDPLPGSAVYYQMFWPPVYTASRVTVRAYGAPHEPTPASHGQSAMAATCFVYMLHRSDGMGSPTWPSP